MLAYPDGTRREFVTLSGYDSYFDTYLLPQAFRSTDSSYQEYRETDNIYAGDLFDKNGTRTSFSLTQVATIQDTNGNRITHVNNGYDPVNGWTEDVLTDSLGRRVRRRVKTGMTTIDVWQAGAANPTTWTMTQNSLTLPNGQSYGFEWTTFGPFTDPANHPTNYYQTFLTKISYPTGGYTRYEWSPLPLNRGVILTARYVNDGTGEVQFTYSSATVGSVVNVTIRKPLSATQPNGDYEVHTFGEGGVAQETKTEYYSSTGVLLKRVERTWRIGPEIVVNPNYAHGLNARVTSVKTSLDPNGINATRRVDYFYDAQGYGIAGDTQTNGNVVEIREYDFGSSPGAVGPLLRKTTNGYLYNTTFGHATTEVNPSSSTLHILDRPTQTVVYTGSGVQKQRTNYYYDSYTSPRTLIATSGATQRNSTFGTTYYNRGNLSRVSRWWDTNGSYLDTWYRYDVCGNIREETDPGNHKTTYTYNSTYQYAYPNQTIDANGFTSSRAYGFASGSPYNTGFGWLTSETDINGWTTSYARDVFGRTRTVNYPDGGLVETYYSDLDASAYRGGSPVFPGGASPPRIKTYTKIQSTPLL